jgi:hypothetical protein
MSIPNHFIVEANIDVSRQITDLIIINNINESDFPYNGHYYILLTSKCRLSPLLITKKMSISIPI